MVQAVETPTQERQDECPRYNVKPSDSEALVLELWEMWSTSLLRLLLGPLKPGVVVPDRVPSMGQIELFDHLSVCKITDIKLNC